MHSKVHFIIYWVENGVPNLNNVLFSLITPPHTHTHPPYPTPTHNKKRSSDVFLFPIQHIFLLTPLPPLQDLLCLFCLPLVSPLMISCPLYKAQSVGKPWHNCWIYIIQYYTLYEHMYLVCVICHFTYFYRSHTEIVQGIYWKSDLKCCVTLLNSLVHISSMYIWSSGINLTGYLKSELGNITKKKMVQKHY